MQYQEVTTIGEINQSSDVPRQEKTMANTPLQQSLVWPSQATKL